MAKVTRGGRRHLVTFSNPGAHVPDGDGGYTSTYATLSPPTRMAEIKPATARDLERITAGTAIGTETQIITCDFHPGITLETRATWTDMAGVAHTANVTGPSNPDGRCIDHVLVCVEVVS